MKVSIDTKEDSYEEIRKVIKMLENLVGGSQEVFTNQQPAIFDDNTASSENMAIPRQESKEEQTQEEQSSQEEQNSQQVQNEETEEVSGSAEDLFAELFSEEELKKMDTSKIKEDDEDKEEIKPKSKKYSIELY